MGTSGRRQRHRASLRREILDAASRLFVEEGYQRFTMRRIAERIEYSPTTIYLYFKDKNELLEAICDETFSELGGKLEQLQKTAGTPLDFLRHGLQTCVDFGLAHSNQDIRTISNPTMGPNGWSTGRSVGSRAFEILRQSVRACAENGTIRTPDVDLTTQALWASVHGITSMSLSMTGHPSAARPAIADHLIATLIAGLSAPAPAPRTSARAQSKKWDFYD
jgi:AcrR family transcriptional regulator